MPVLDTASSPEKQSVTRRGFIAGGAAVAVALPAAALAIEEAEPVCELSTEDQLETAIAGLRAILARMHPEADDERLTYTPLDEGRSYFFVIVGHAPARAVWDGPGEYEVCEARYQSAGVYYIDRIWSEMDKRHILLGSFIWDGQLTAPRTSIDPRCLIRKLAKPTNRNCQPPRRNKRLAIDG